MKELNENLKSKYLVTDEIDENEDSFLEDDDDDDLDLYDKEPKLKKHQSS